MSLVPGIYCGNMRIMINHDHAMKKKKIEHTESGFEMPGHREKLEVK